MSTATSLWMQARPEDSSWHAAISTQNLQAIADRIEPAYGADRSALLCEGLLDSAWFGGVATVRKFLELNAPIDCVDRDGRSPLLRSIERNEDNEVAKFLIERGANVNQGEYLGRTPLMQCIWRNRMIIFDVLLKHDNIDIERVDFRERTALHHLAADADRSDEVQPRSPEYSEKSPHDKDILDRLVAKGANVNRIDAFKRTVLHWAARYGNSKLIKLIFDKRQLDKQAHSVKDYQQRSPLHVAAANGNFKTMDIILDNVQIGEDRYNPINNPSNGEWTVLLLVLRHAHAPLSIVERLVKLGADVNRCAQDGKNALHLAALTGNHSLVKFVLKQPKMQRMKRDDFGDTPLLCAARCEHGDIAAKHRLLRLFAPWDESFRPHGHAELAAREYRPLMYDFTKATGVMKELEWSTPLTMFDLIYAPDRDHPNEPAIKTVSEEGHFKWIHIPANSIPWCLDLISKHFIEHSAQGDVHGLRDLERSFAYHERHSKYPHFSYMTPICETISKSEATGNTVVGVPPRKASSYDAFRAMQEKRTQRTTIMLPLSSNPISKLQLQPHLARQSSLFHADDTFPWYSTSTRVQIQRPGEIDQEKVQGKTEPSSPTRIQFVTDDDIADSDDTSIRSMFLFMPYLNHELTKAQIEMCKAADAVAKEADHPELVAEHDKEFGPRNMCLLRAHMSSSRTMSLHLRRTLDQYFYQHIDTADRDKDQVFQRDQAKRPHAKGDHLRTLMVDQLWMLVLSEDLIITSFPKAWKARATDPSDMLRRVIDFIRSNNNNEVRSVYELSMLIVGQFYGSFHRFAGENDEYEFLNMFKTALGGAMNQEVALMNEFKPASAVTSAHLRSLINVRRETSLLKEVKDITDEIGILDMVLSAQEHVHLQMKVAFNDLIKANDRRKRQRAYKTFDEHERAIEHPHQEVWRMAGQSEKIQHSILALLDLKQKHANALQAYNTARSGTTLMVFTIVTVIFLPLTFISSFFTMEITEFPRDDQGVNLPAYYVMTFVFGIGAPVATALVVIALSAEMSNEMLTNAWLKIVDFFRPGQQEVSPVQKFLNSESSIDLPDEFAGFSSLHTATGDMERSRLEENAPSMRNGRLPEHTVELHHAKGLAP